MRIVLAHKYFYRGGGTATYLLELIRQLSERGHECLPFTVAYEQTIPRENWDYYVSPPLGQATTHLKDMKLSPAGMLRLLGRAIWSSEAYRQALRLTDDLRPDIAFVHNLYSYMSPSPIVAFKRRGLPVVMRVSDYNMLCPGLTVLRDGQPCTECVEHGFAHALKFRCHKGSLAATSARVASMYAHRWRHVYDHVDTFFTPSRFLGNLLVKAGYPAEKVRHLPSFYPAPALDPVPADGGYVLYFGRVAPEKGLDVLVRALALLDSDVPVLVAGADVDGETVRLQALAGELGVRNLQFVGMKAREELDALIAGAMFTVVPSRWYDNCPMSVLESFAQAKPVVGAAIGGIPEQIAEGCGLLFEPGQAESLAQQMETMLGAGEGRQAMGAAALAHLRANFSPQRHCDTLLAECARLLDSRREGRQSA